MGTVNIYRYKTIEANGNTGVIPTTYQQIFQPLPVRPLWPGNLPKNGNLRTEAKGIPPYSLQDLLVVGMTPVFPSAFIVLYLQIPAMVVASMGNLPKNGYLPTKAKEIPPYSLQDLLIVGMTLVFPSASIILNLQIFTVGGAKKKTHPVVKFLFSFYHSFFSSFF